MKPVDPHAYAMIEDSGRHAVTLAEGAKVSLAAMLEKVRREREATVRLAARTRAEADSRVQAIRVEAASQTAAARQEADARIEAMRQECEAAIASARSEAEAQVSQAWAEANRAAADAYAERDRVTEEVRAASSRVASELKQARSELAEVLLENDTLKKNHVVLMQNQRRLYMGFVSLLKSVEDACGAEIGVDQRIEATLLSSDIGGLLGEADDLSTAKAREFLSLTEQTQSRSFQTESSHA